MFMDKLKKDFYYKIFYFENSVFRLVILTSFLVVRYFIQWNVFY